MLEGQPMILICSLLMMAVGCASHPAASPPVAVDYNAKPPFTPVELWQKLVLLLKESDQRMTPERFETLLGVHFTEVRHDPDVTVYLIREHRDWYMTANVVVVNADYHPPAPENYHPHSGWTLSWKKDTFGDPARQECLTATRVHADLLFNGWTSPWTQLPADQAKPPDPVPAQPAASLGQVIEPRIPASFGFRRQVDARVPFQQALPRGWFFTTGEQLTHCITGISVNAPP
jgi:hypothetical protein